jgi:hypothetical protein
MSIAFLAPDISAYTGTPWDLMGDDAVWGNFWDSNTDTKGNLTVTLAVISG